MAITVNQKNPSGYVVLRTTATDFLKLNSSGAVQGANSIGETVISMSISEIMWSANGNNTWTINRGSNTVAVLSGSGWHDYQSSGIKLEDSTAQATSNVVVTLSGGGGFIAVKLHKVSGE